MTDNTKKPLEDLSIIELKAILFDVANKVKMEEEVYRKVLRILNTKINKEKVPK